MTTADTSEPRRPQQRPFLIPTVFSIFVMMTLVLLAPIMTADGPPDGSGNTIRQIAYLLLFISTVGMIGGFQKPQKLVALPITVLLTIGWCWLSVVWAIEPVIAARRLALTTLVIWTIYLAVQECGFERTVKTAMICLVVLLIANYIAVVAAPQVGIHQPDTSRDAGLIGDWKGILPQKNFTGATCALTLLLFGFASQKMSLVLRLGVMAAAAFFLWKTESKTSMGMLGLAAAVGLIYMRFPPRARLIMIPLVAIAGIALLMYSITAWDETLGPFAKRDGLTGRVQIWPYLFAYVADHPFTGAGYGSFWNIGEESPIYSYTRNWVATISNGHNGYIDLLVQIGWPGLILTVLATMVLPLWRLLANSEIARSRGAMLMGLLVFCIGHNFTETSLLERDVIVGVFLIFAGALTHVLDRRSGRPAQTAGSRRGPGPTRA